MASPEQGARRLLHLGLMYLIRYTPVPWALREWGINLLTPSTVVIGTAIIPDAEGRVLMLRARYSGRWIPPGGAVHPGEDPRAGAERECREELGRRVSIEAQTGVYALPGTRLLFIVFRCAPLSGPPHLSAEHEAWRYMLPETLPRRFRIMAGDALTRVPEANERTP